MNGFEAPENCPDNIPCDYPLLDGTKGTWHDFHLEATGHCPGCKTELITLQAPAGYNDGTCGTGARGMSHADMPRA